MFSGRGGIIEDGFERGNNLYHITGHMVELQGRSKVTHRKRTPANCLFNHGLVVSL